MDGTLTIVIFYSFHLNYDTYWDEGWTPTPHHIAFFKTALVTKAINILKTQSLSRVPSLSQNEAPNHPQKLRLSLHANISKLM